jgi:hypothetical protein
MSAAATLSPSLATEMIASAELLAVLLIQVAWANEQSLAGWGSRA